MGVQVLKSTYDDRDTVGSTYIKAQKNKTAGLTIGEINDEMVKSLLEDIEGCMNRNPFEDRPFYINIVEERDLQMPNTFKRRIFETLYLPYPEDNTLVFYIKPKSGDIFYCWDLPHHSEIPNIITNEHLYDNEYIKSITAWMRNDLENFGFIKVSMDSSQVEGYEEKTINAYRAAYHSHCEMMGMDRKSLEVEKKLGFFWIPNKFWKPKCLTSDNPKVFIC